MLSAVCVAAVLTGFVKVQAGPVRFDQVVQIMNAHPAKAESSNFTRLKVQNYYSGALVGVDDPATADDDDKKKSSDAGVQDDRVITETRTDIVLDDDCQCDNVEPGVVHRGGFPKWALLGLAAIPVAAILIKHNNDNDRTRTPTPTPTTPTTPTPTTPTPTTPTPTTPTPTTPTPQEPVPEPMTILLFGTGLASVGMAARRRFGKKGQTEDEGDNN